VPEAIRKAVEDAKRNIVAIPMVGTPLPHSTLGVYSGGRVLLKPAAEGSGVAAGGASRAIMDLGGVADVTAKSLGSATPINVVRATFEAIKSLKNAEEVAEMRQVSLEHLAD